MAARAGANVVNVLFYLNEKPQFLQIGNHGFSCLIAIHSRVFSALFVNGGVLVHDVDYFQIMAETYLVVVGIVSGGDFNNARAEFHIHIFVGNNGYLLIYQGQYYLFSYYFLIALIIGIDRNGSVAQKRFGTGGGYFHKAAAVGKGIFNVPEVTRLFFVLAFDIADTGLTVGAPVDYSFPVINQSLVVQVDKHLLYRLGTALVKSESEPVPVAGATQFCKLLAYSPLILVLPLPCPFKEAIPAHVVLGKSFLLHSRDDFRLGGNGRVVGAGKPESAEALHSLIANYNILKSLVKSVPRMKLSRNVGRGDNYGKWGLVFVYYGVEIFLFQPVLIYPVLKILWGVGFRQFFLHCCLYPFILEVPLWHICAVYQSLFKLT